MREPSGQLAPRRWRSPGSRSRRSSAPCTSLRTEEGKLGKWVSPAGPQGQTLPAWASRPPAEPRAGAPGQRRRGSVRARGRAAGACAAAPRPPAALAPRPSAPRRRWPSRHPLGGALPLLGRYRHRAREAGARRGARTRRAQREGGRGCAPRPADCGGPGPRRRAAPRLGRRAAGETSPPGRTGAALREGPASLLVYGKVSRRAPGLRVAEQGRLSHVGVQESFPSWPEIKHEAKDHRFQHIGQ